ncbi:hypothetical protein Vadar_012749 [Vaccinium darrowii]|uniref:Uncharacterized protein n=1 Tax=Vaccinium darrowii TaxID=229202 RepID=A0ACB7Y7J2_9ERIC|nr:hypothetical protein Vadar_012749 [Vaccinium darrowii]
MCDNILWTILGILGKSKDNINARRDLKRMKIRKALHVQRRGSKKAYLPLGQFTMSKDDKDFFLKVLKNVKAPDGYASNISRHVRLKERSIGGLKSHDSHVLMQQLIPVAIRKSLPKKVVEPLIELSIFFSQLCSKGNRASDLEYLRDRIALTLCHLEKIFPPAFFDIMEHLPIHLVDEALIAGPVPYRWMYPIERYLLTLKRYVPNQACPEASIAKGYLMEQCMQFCARYLHEVETKSNRLGRNYDGGDRMGRAVGENTLFHLNQKQWIQAHRYVLFNTSSVAPFVNEHLEFLMNKMPRVGDHQIRREHFETFHTWFKEHVQTLRRSSEINVSEEIQKLAIGPHDIARRFSGYIVNGYRFHVRAIDNNRATQNSGVALKADTVSVASRKDKNPRVGAVYYYGQLTDIIEIRYTNDTKFVLFKCNWIDNVHGKKEDAFKFTLVNFNHLLYRGDQTSDELFILASQANQVWYLPDPVEPSWQVVVKMSQRALFDMHSEDPHTEPYVSQELDDNIVLRDEEAGWGGMLKRKAKHDLPRNRPHTMFEACQRREVESDYVEYVDHTSSQSAPSRSQSHLAPSQPASKGGMSKRKAGHGLSGSRVNTMSEALQRLAAEADDMEDIDGISSQSPSLAPSFQPASWVTPIQETELSQSHRSTSHDSVARPDPSTTNRGQGCAKRIKQWGTGTKLKDNVMDCPEEFYSVAMSLCNKLWKDHKSKSKRIYYKPYIDDPNIDSKVPKDILPDQWADLVKYWRNKHVKMEAAGEAIDKMSVFMKTHDLNDPDVKEFVDDYNDRLSQIDEPLQTIEIRDKIFHQVFGEDGHGYCLTYGTGVPRSAVYKKNAGLSEASSASTIDEITRQVHEKLSGEIEQRLTIEIEQRLTAEMEERLRREVEQRLTEEIEKKLNEKLMEQLKNMEARMDFFEFRAGVDASKQVLDAGSGHRATSEHRVPSEHHTASGHRGAQESVGDDIDNGSELLGTRRTNSQQVIRQKVCLASFHIPKQDVVEGFVVSKDPLLKIDGVPLGLDFWKELVKV